MNPDAWLSLSAVCGREKKAFLKPSCFILVPTAYLIAASAEMLVVITTDVKVL